MTGTRLSTLRALFNLIFSMVLEVCALGQTPLGLDLIPFIYKLCDHG